MTPIEEYLNDFKEEKECTYKGERYSVRDNGAILRHPKDPKRIRQNDNIWTFGKPGDKGYLYISGVQVHRIVATAYLSNASESNLIVDHINTNKQDNRVANIRWITREENIIGNPNTLKKIIYRTGLSLEELKKNNWKDLHNLNKSVDTSWMKHINDKEANILEKHQEYWLKSESLRTSKGKMDEWVFDTAPKPTYIPSLTPNAVQRDWKTPCEFPCCPSEITNNPLETYKNNLKVNVIFSKNKYYATKCVGVDYSKDKKSLIVKAINESIDSVKNFYLAQISFEDNLYVHTNLSSFFGEDGMEKYFCKYTGKKWTGGDVFDDFC